MTGARDKPLRHVYSCRKHHDEEVASSKKKKKKTNSRLECINRYPIYDQSGCKTIPFGALTPPPPGGLWSPLARSYEFEIHLKSVCISFDATLVRRF